MARFILFVCLLCYTVVGALGQVESDNKIYKLLDSGLKGNVKKVVVYEYEILGVQTRVHRIDTVLYFDSGRGVLRNCYTLYYRVNAKIADTILDRKSKDLITFNLIGKIIRSEERFDGPLEDTSSRIIRNRYDKYNNLVENIEVHNFNHLYDSQRVAYIYDTKNRLKEKMSTTFINNHARESISYGTRLVVRVFDDDTVGSSRYIYTYDTCSRKIKESCSCSNSAYNQYTVFHYDYEGKRSASETFHADGNYVQRKFDTSGNIIEEIEKHNQDTSRQIWLYNTDGKFIEQRSYYQNNLKLTKSTNHDENGNVIEIIEWNPENNYKSVLHANYEYDKYGNYIRKTEFHDGKMNKYIERVIEYH